MRRISNWRSPEQTRLAIENRQLWRFRTCGGCGHFDLINEWCCHNGFTPVGASCDFWAEGF